MAKIIALFRKPKFPQVQFSMKWVWFVLMGVMLGWSLYFAYSRYSRVDVSTRDMVVWNVNGGQMIKCLSPRGCTVDTDRESTYWKMQQDDVITIYSENADRYTPSFWPMLLPLLPLLALAVAVAGVFFNEMFLKQYWEYRRNQNGYEKHKERKAS